jgi:hypothetical protein
LDIGALTPKLEKLIHTLEWVRIEEFVGSTWSGIGRRPHDRGALANAFVAKAVLGLPTTAALIERLRMDRSLKRICGFPMWKRLPDESSFRGPLPGLLKRSWPNAYTKRWSSNTWAMS